jgi:uncharacterized protein (DUF433 family)
LKSWKTEESPAVQVSFLPFLKDVERRLNQLSKAQEMVVEDLEIFRGTPIIRGTRIPVHDVADLMEAETPMSELKELYPRLSHEQFDLALTYAKAHPRRGRPRRRTFPKGLEVFISKKQLRDASIGGLKLAQTTNR